MWRGEVRRGRAGRAFDFGEPGVLDGATAKSLAAGRRGPRQVGQIVKTKPPRRSCLRILDQSLEPREESRSNSTETTMHGSGGSVERRVHDWNQVVAYSVRTPNRVHVAAGQYLYCTSPSTSPRATKPIVRLSRELLRLSPSTKHIPSGTFALG